MWAIWRAAFTGRLIRPSLLIRIATNRVASNAAKNENRYDVQLFTLIHTMIYELTHNWCIIPHEDLVNDAKWIVIAVGLWTGL